MIIIYNNNLVSIQCQILSSLMNNLMFLFCSSMAAGGSILLCVQGLRGACIQPVSGCSSKVQRQDC